MRIRTLSNAIKELQIDDPKCCLTLSALRRLVITGKIPSTRSGTKYLVDVDALSNVLFKVDKEDVKCKPLIV